MKVQDDESYDKLQKRMEVGNNIRKLRLAKGITQEHLAQQICLLQNSLKGGSPQTIYRIENGICDFGIDSFLAISEVLRVPPGYFFDSIDDGQKLLEIIVENEERNEQRFQILVSVLERIGEGIHNLEERGLR